MFNRYFEAGENSIEFLFAHITVKNIDFALISLSCLLERNDIDYNLYHDDHTYYFFHIQSVLIACGNISNVFYGGNTKLSNRNNMWRTTLLRNTFNITKSDFPLVFQKEIRNTNAHFDERFDRFNGNIGDYNILDENTSRDMRETIISEPHLRTFDRTNRCYYTYGGSHNSQLRPLTYNFNELRKQLLTMKERITTHPIFESRWIDRMPDDIIKN